MLGVVFLLYLWGNVTPGLGWTFISISLYIYEAGALWQGHLVFYDYSFILMDIVQICYY